MPPAQLKTGWREFLRAIMKDMSASVEKIKIPGEIRVLIAAAFIIAIGFGIITPVLPQYAESFGVGAFGVSAVVSIFGLARLIFAPASGRLTMKFGESGVYITGVTIVGISMFAVAFAQTYTQLLIFRGLGGFGSTLFTVSAMSFLAAKAPPTIRGRVSGAYASAFLIGNISGPLVGGLLVALGPRAPFLIYGGALLIAAFVVYLGLHRQKNGKRHKVVDERMPWNFGDAIKDQSYRAALGSFFANGWASFGVRNAIMPLFAAAAFAGTGFFLDGPQTAAVALSIFAAGNVIAVTFSSRLSDKYGRKPLIVIGLAVAAIGTGVLGFMTSPMLFFIASLIAGAGTGMMNAPQQAAIADLVGQERKAGTVMSAAQMASDVGSIIGPLFIGWIVDLYGFELGFAITGGILAVACIVWTFAPETNVRVAGERPLTGSVPTVSRSNGQSPSDSDQA